MILDLLLLIKDNFAFRSKKGGMSPLLIGAILLVVVLLVVIAAISSQSNVIEGNSNSLFGFIKGAIGSND